MPVSVAVVAESATDVVGVVLAVIRCSPRNPGIRIEGQAFRVRHRTSLPSITIDYLGQHGARIGVDDEQAVAAAPRAHVHSVQGPVRAEGHAPDMGEIGCAVGDVEDAHRGSGCHVRDVQSVALGPETSDSCRGDSSPVPYCHSASPTCLRRTGPYERRAARRDRRSRRRGGLRSWHAGCAAHPNRSARQYWTGYGHVRELQLRANRVQRALRSQRSRRGSRSPCSLRLPLPRAPVCRDRRRVHGPPGFRRIPLPESWTFSVPTVVAVPVRSRL